MKDASYFRIIEKTAPRGILMHSCTLLSRRRINELHPLPGIPSASCCQWARLNLRRRRNAHPRRNSGLKKRASERRDRQRSFYASWCQGASGGPAAVLPCQRRDLTGHPVRGLAAARGLERQVSGHRQRRLQRRYRLQRSRERGEARLRHLFHGHGSCQHHSRSFKLGRSAARTW
jgi:hypothetical protein